MVNKKIQVWLPLLFAIVMIAGMLIGSQLQDPFRVKKQGAVQEALDLIKLKYVDSVHTDSLESGAIEEMMSKLDPHSVYFPPVELKEANEELAGNFEGIGVEFNVFADTVNVLYVIPEGPSDKVLEIGDKIIKVNDYSLVAKNLATDTIKKYIRGER